MIKKTNAIVLFLSLFFIQAYSQEAFTVIGLEGTARVQRSQERSWKKLEIGSKLSDNDLVETYFQTKLIMQFGANNLIILGSNSKALLNSTAAIRDKRSIIEISATLFSGGIFSKAISNCRVNIYTANAVGVMDSGSVTVVAEGKTGETGFQVLGGQIAVRNIAQQKTIDLRSGLTTMIQPNKEPTAPLYITHRHVAVLKHFFGDEYITGELNASGISPTEERSSSGAKFQPFSTKSQSYSDEGMDKSLFNLNRIYGSVLEDQQKNSQLYRPLLPPTTFVSGQGMVSFDSDVGFSQNVVSPRIIPSVSYLKGKFDIGVRLSFVQTDTGGFSGGFSSLAGIVDKIHHVAYGNATTRWSVFAGQIENYTFGYGLIVDNFTNVSYNNGFHPLGLTMDVRIRDEILIRAFTADCFSPLVNGVYVAYQPSKYRFGLGYVGDVNQYSQMVNSTALRFASFPETDRMFPDISEKSMPVHCLLFDFSADLVDRYDFQLAITAEFARMLFNGKSGMVVRIPGFRCNFYKNSFGAAFVSETGLLLSSQFDELYLDRRYTVKTDTRNRIDSVLTPNNRLAKSRNTFGLTAFYKINPYRGTDIDFTYKQDIMSRTTMIGFASDTVFPVNISYDFNFRLRLAVNDSLVKFIRHAQLVIQQSHGRLTSLQRMPFSSWTFNGRFSVISVPLFFNIAFETGIDFFYFDTGKKRNNSIDGEDMFFVVKAGVHWGFK